MMTPQITREDGDYLTDQYTVKGNCRNCGDYRIVKIPGPGLFAYNNGAAVQDAFPGLSDEDREMLFISGICGVCWNEMFPDED